MRAKVALDPSLSLNCTMSVPYRILVISKRLRESAMVKRKKEKWIKTSMSVKVKACLRILSPNLKVA